MLVFGIGLLDISLSEYPDKSHKFTNLSFYDITVTLKGFQLMEPEHFSSCSFWTNANISHNFTNLVFVTSSILFSKVVQREKALSDF